MKNKKIKQVYTPNDLKKIKYKADIADPGKFPYTRGIYPNMYQGKLWTMRQFAGLGTAAETNKRFKYLLKNGQMGLSVAFDLPTLMGLDSDHDMAAGEVGFCGVAIDTIKDMETLFSGIPLNKVTTSMTINAPAAALYAMYLIVAKKQKVSMKNVSGTIQNDILKEFIAQKEWIYPPGAHLKLITDTIIYSAKNTPKWHPISISGYHMREAGSTAAQELAFTLYNGLTYANEVIRAGCEIDDFAPRLSFFFNAHNDFFEEIAKYRAARRIWAKEIKKRYKPKNPESCVLRFHTQTAGCSLVRQQPLNNITRVTIQALAGVLGGTQSLHTDSMDETFATPTEEAATVALRTQQIIAHESGVTKTADPLGGSYFIESLTSKIEDDVYSYFDKLDDLGGMVKAIEAGYPQKQIQEAAYAYQREVDAKKQIIVGLNDFHSQKEEEVPIKTLFIDPVLEEQQIKKLRAIKKERSQETVKRVITRLQKTAQKGENIMPVMIEAVKSLATIGEISSALATVYGTYTEPDEIKGRTKTKKTILVSKVGQDGHDRGVKVLIRLLKDNGFNVIYTGLRKTPQEIVSQALDQNVDSIGISILSGAHKTWLPRIVSLLNKKSKKVIPIFAGGIIPKEDRPGLKKIGITGLFLPGTPLDEIIDFVKKLHK